MYWDSVEEIRRHLGYTQARMALMIGLSEPEYSRMRNGHLRPGLDLLGRIVRAFPILERATWDYVRGVTEMPQTAATIGIPERKVQSGRGRKLRAANPPMEGRNGG